MKRNIIGTLIIVSIGGISAQVINNFNKENGEVMNGGINKKDRAEMIEYLNQLLADEFTLYVKTLKYHWNVRGEHFGSLHTLFRTQYEELFQTIDDLAERIRALQFMPFATLQEYIDNTELTEAPGKNPTHKKMIGDLVRDYELIIQNIREIISFATSIKDEATVNFLGDVIEEHEKAAWMLRSHIE